MNEDRLPKLGDLVKMKIDEDRGVAGIIHKVRSLKVDPGVRWGVQPHHEGEVYDIIWPDGIQSVQYQSEIRVISRS